jgi:hypothetical protein
VTAERLKQYEICQQRGHVADPFSGISYTQGYHTSPIRYVCKFCGTTFWTETHTTEHEENAPVGPDRGGKSK